MTMNLQLSPRDQFITAVYERLDVARHIDPEIDPDWLHFVADTLPQASRTHAQIFQDLWVIWETGGARDGYFVEFGACDGRFLSNSLLLEEDYGWNGIVAEPNPVFRDAIVANRRCIVDHRCVWRASGETLPFKMVAEPEYSVLEGIDPGDHHEEIGVRKDYQLVDVPTVSLRDLLCEAGAPRAIDYLSLDTEGSELDILQAFDFTEYDIRMITVEHNGSRRRADIQALLASHGYRLRFPGMTRWDDWFIR